MAKLIPVRKLPMKLTPASAAKIRMTANKKVFGK